LCEGGEVIPPAKLLPGACDIELPCLWIGIMVRGCAVDTPPLLPALLIIICCWCANCACAAVGGLDLMFRSNSSAAWVLFCSVDALALAKAI
jgi:hypothetical protein